MKQVFDCFNSADHNTNQMSAINNILILCVYVLLTRNSEWNYQNNGRAKADRIQSIRSIFCWKQNSNILWQEMFFQKDPNIKDKGKESPSFRTKTMVQGAMENRFLCRNPSIQTLWVTKGDEEKACRLFFPLSPFQIPFRIILSNLVVAFWFYANPRLNQDLFFW